MAPHISGSPARRFRADPRFIIGLVLVAAAVVGVWLLVATATRGTSVYLAKHTLVAGDRITADDLTVAEVRIGGAADRYLDADEAVADGAVARATVRAGELVPRSAVGSSAPAGIGRVVLRVAGPLPSAVRVGDQADVWATAQTRSGTTGTPHQIAADVTVAAVTKADGVVASDVVAVEVAAPSADVSGLLAASAGDDTINLVVAGSGSTRESR